MHNREMKGLGREIAIEYGRETQRDGEKQSWVCRFIGTLAQYEK